MRLLRQVSMWIWIRQLVGFILFWVLDSH
jgi:hypothetical protein